jgi:hypothetical protein
MCSVCHVLCTYLQWRRASCPFLWISHMGCSQCRHVYMSLSLQALRMCSCIYTGMRQVLDTSFLLYAHKYTYMLIHALYPRQDRKDGTYRQSAHGTAEHSWRHLYGNTHTHTYCTYAGGDEWWMEVEAISKTPEGTARLLRDKLFHEKLLLTLETPVKSPQFDHSMLKKASAAFRTLTNVCAQTMMVCCACRRMRACF